jgi:hypothetical protein
MIHRTRARRRERLLVTTLTARDGGDAEQENSAGSESRSP